jgi:sec-independent protein translocase protein TatA
MSAGSNKMFGLGTQEIVLIALVILVLFGAKKIPDLMSGLGKGIREFKKASKDIETEITSTTTEEKKQS